MSESIYPSGMPFGNLGQDAEACPVCGAAKGQCPVTHRTDRASVKMKTVFRPETHQEEQMEGDVVATTRIWEDVPIPKSTRFRRVLRYRPGDVVRAADAERLAVDVNGVQSSVPRATFDGSGVIPLAGPPLETQVVEGPPETSDEPPSIETTEGGPAITETTEATPERETT